MEHKLNLDAYLARIGGIEGAAPDLATLQQIVRQHIEHIPFENLNVLMGWPVLLDLPALEQKLVFDGRGGYCFEQNLLLKAALDRIGVHATGLSARVLWDAPAGSLRPRTHMLLRVDFGAEAYIVDVGFGGLTPTGVLRLEARREQQTPLETYRLLRWDDEYTLEVRLDAGWTTLYRFDLQPQLLPDYEVANWYVSTHPQSHFRHVLSVARAGRDARYTLANAEFTVRGREGRADKRTVGSAEDLRAVLGDSFGLRLPQCWELDEVIDRVVMEARTAACN